MTVTVTEVASGAEFFLQAADEPRVAWIEEQLKALSASDPSDGAGGSGAAPAAAGPIAQGSTVLAQYSLDGRWYRAYVERVHPSEPKYEVFFLDYGNRERAPAARVKAAGAALAAVPAQARAAQLAYVRVR